MANQLPPDKLHNEYESQLRRWISQSGKSHTELAELTRYFAIFLSNERQMRGDTFSKTLQNIPSRNGVNNLCAILSVFYMLYVLQKSDIEAFILKYGIPISNVEWKGFWQTIEAGTAQGRLELPHLIPVTNLEAEEIPPKPINRQRRSLVLGILITLVAIGIFAFFVVQLLSSRQNLSPTQPCLETFPRAEPTFLRDQGFSHYLVETSPVIGQSILSNNIRSIGINKQGLWVGYKPLVERTDKVSVFDKTNWTHYCTGTLLSPYQNVNSFIFLNGRTYMATDGVGVGEFDGTNWRFYTQKEGLPSNSVYLLTVIEGEVWAGTYEGAARLTNGQWRTEYRGQSNQLVSNHVIIYVLDKRGNHWFGLLDRGIGRLDAQGRWHSYFADDTNLQHIRDIAVDENGGVWFATDRGGISLFQDETWRLFNVTNGQLPSDSVQDVEIDPLGRLWAATPGGLVYTADFGTTWTTHSTMDTLDVEFGCKDCPYFDQNHMIILLNGSGLGHIRIPPLNPTIEFVSVPSRVQLRPKQEYIFEVEVHVLSEGLTPTNVRGDSLRNSDPLDTYLHGAHHTIGVANEVPVGETYIFSNVDNPIIAPEEPGLYVTHWRVFQAGRYVTKPVAIEFEVIQN